MNNCLAMLYPLRSYLPCYQRQLVSIPLRHFTDMKHEIIQGVSAYNVNHKQCFYCTYHHGVLKNTASTEEDLETKRVTRLNEESTFISQNICKDDIGDVHGESIEKRLLHIKMLNMERESLRALGNRVPLSVQDKHLDRLLSLRTVNAREKFYGYLFQIEVRSLAYASKAEERQIQHLERIVENKRKRADGEVASQIYFMIRQTTMNRAYYHNMAFAEMFGPTILFDLSFEMKSPKELSSLVQQLSHCHHTNKVNVDPFNVIMCGMKGDGRLRELLQSGLFQNDLIPGMNMSEKSYMDMYPQEKLIYLTPNSPHVMRDYDHESIYIIGGIVDLAEEKPLTMAKAKRQKIRTAKLPLDRYLQWKIGSKALTLNSVFNILIDKKNGKGWEQTLPTHVSNRLFLQKENVKPYPKHRKKIKY